MSTSTFTGVSAFSPTEVRVRHQLGCSPTGHQVGLQQATQHRVVAPGLVGETTSVGAGPTADEPTATFTSSAAVEAPPILHTLASRHPQTHGNWLEPRRTSYQAAEAGGSAQPLSYGPQAQAPGSLDTQVWSPLLPAALWSSRAQRTPSPPGLPGGRYDRRLSEQTNT